MEGFSLRSSVCCSLTNVTNTHRFFCKPLVIAGNLSTSIGSFEHFIHGFAIFTRRRKDKNEEGPESQSFQPVHPCNDGGGAAAILSIDYGWLIWRYTTPLFMLILVDQATNRDRTRVCNGSSFAKRSVSTEGNDNSTSVVLLPFKNIQFFGANTERFREEQS